MTTVPPGTPASVLAGHHVVFTGRLVSLSRKEARLLVSRLGGTPGDEVTARTTMLVVGAGAAWPGGEGRLAGGDGEDEKSQKIQRAEAINQKEPGRVRIVPEDEFCDLAGVPSPGELRHQWFALRDILTMYPRLREDHLRYLRKWNLIQPALKTNAETYYAFPDLTVIRHVHAELEHGTPFRTALRLVQASREGQLRLDFSPQAAPAKVIGLRRPPAEPTATPASPVDTEAAEEFFRDGSALDDGDPRKYEAASRAYRRALEIDPGLVPALINLANLHYAQDHLVEAELLYAQAIELAPDVFEAHFNLGNVYHDLGRLPEARACYENAVGLNEAYPEAHFYLAVTLEKLGLSGAARPHWRRYQQLAPEGEWVELAREFGDQ